MKMNKINQNSCRLTVLLSNSLMVLLSYGFFSGCKEEGRIDYFDRNAPAPEQVTEITVRNTPGGAVLKYKLPNDKNLLYVKALYEIQPGVIREAKASYVVDSLVLEGYGDVRTYDVELFSVGKNEKVSASQIVQVTPTTPPVLLATKSMREAFGGLRIDVINPEKAALAFVLLADTAKLGYFTELYTFYIGRDQEKATFSFRGLDTLQFNFGVYCRDRWENYSDTVYASLKPWFEEFIPKNTWSIFALPGDPGVVSGFPLSNMWNGVTGLVAGNNYHTLDVPLPTTATWNLGQTVVLSRFQIWPRNHPNGDDMWVRGHPKVFELYGSMAPNSDGSMDDSWTPLGRFEIVKPSGDGPVTQDDINASVAGFEFDFEVNEFAPDPFVQVRYLRLRTLSTYANTTISPVSIKEISFWGIIQ